MPAALGIRAAVAGGRPQALDLHLSAPSLFVSGRARRRLLTGELPFRGETQTLLAQIQNDEPPSPRKLNASVPRDLETIVLKAIARDASHRYATAGDMADDLWRFVDDRPIRARRVSFLEHGWRWCRRLPVRSPPPPRNCSTP